MFALLKFVSFLSMANAINYFSEKESFDQYISKYNKSYSSREYWYRYHIYETNLNYIDERNSNITGYRLGINNFTDMTTDEFSTIYLNKLLNTSEVIHSNYNYTNIILPPSVDWRASGLVTNVKNQGQCGSCWAFSAIGTLEGQHAKNTSNLVSLSEQNLVDCAWNYSCEGCNGGWPDKALEYIKNNSGIDTEMSYPYLGTDGSCNYNRSQSSANVSDVVMLPRGNMTVLYNALATVGPISVALDAEEDFQMYSSGIFNSTACSNTMLDHAVLAVGYGVAASNQSFLIIKNSWGTDWGMDGYIYFSTEIDNMCGIAQHCSYPVV